MSSTYRGVASQHAQLLAGDQFVLVVDDTQLAAIDVRSGALTWQRTLVPPAMNTWRAVSWLAEDGRGVLWATVATQSGRQRSASLMRLELATGALRGETTLEGVPRGLVLDGLGRAYLVRAVPPTNGRSFFESFEVTGALRFSVMQSAQAPVLVDRDVVVMADDTARSTLDGRELWGADPDFDTRQWGGVVARGGVQFRLGAALNSFVPTVRVARVEPSGARSEVVGVAAEQASELYLTFAGDLLVATSSPVET